MSMKSVDMHLDIFKTAQGERKIRFGTDQTAFLFTPREAMDIAKGMIQAAQAIELAGNTGDIVKALETVTNRKH